jgi:hypothetical protein
MSVSLAGAALAVSVVGGIAGADSARHNANVQEDIANQSSKNSMSALDAQTKQAGELLDFNKKQYEEGKTRQVGIDAINKQVVNQNLDLSAKAGQRADEQYKFFQDNGQPLIKKTLDDASNFDSQGNIDAARGRAGADVQQGFDNTEQQSQRALTRMGVNPSSGRFLALQQRMSADKALGVAGAETNAEQGIRTQAIGLRQQAGNLASGMPAQSLAQGAQSSGTGVAAAGVAGAGGAQSNAISQQSLNAMNAGAGIYGNAAQGFNSMYGNSIYAMNSANSQANANQAGWGNLAGSALSKFGSGGGFGGAQAAFSQTPVGGSGFGSGMAYGNQDMGGYFADGGKITGPGTGTSDSVEAVNTDNGGRVKLSNGEWIVPADVVRAKGQEFFQKLTDKHHKMVGNVGRNR